MDVAREFERVPPTEPLTTLSALVRDWRMRTGPGGSLEGKRDAVVDYCREALSWTTAVERACRSRRPDGRMHNHQSKVKEADRTHYAGRIIGVWQYDWEKFRTWGFDTWYTSIDDLRIRGIGPVTVYDVAVRVGAYMDIKPQSLYIHAGVAEGWVALRSGMPWRSSLMARRIPRSVWPAAVRDFEADDLEDFLCTYRTLFRQLTSLD